MMAMHSLGLLQVLVRKMQPGAGHQNAEVYACSSSWAWPHLPLGWEVGLQAYLGFVLANARNTALNIIISSAWVLTNLMMAKPQYSSQLRNLATEV